MKKVAILTNNSWQAYNFRFNLAKKLKKNGYKVIFFAPYDKKYSQLLKEEFEFYAIFIDPKSINPISDLKTMISFYKLFKDIRPNVVLNFTIKPVIYGSITSGILKIKSISNITGLGTIFIKQSFVTKIAKLLYKIALRFNSRVFFQNSDDREMFVKYRLTTEDKTDLLPGSGVDLNKFKPKKRLQNSNFRFLFVARVLKDKGILEYIEAIKILKQKYNNIEFQILGEIGVKNKTAITKKELQDWIDKRLVNYLGTTDNVWNVVANCDCVVLPSYREGTPRSLLEASAMQKPIITTNVVGCKEVVDDKINGFLCKVKNAKDLAKKMQMMIELPKSKRFAMGKAGREKMIKEFDEKIVIDKYLKTIKEILK